LLVVVPSALDYLLRSHYFGALRKMELFGTLYFAVCFSIVGLSFLILSVYNGVGIVNRKSPARLSKYGVVNWLFLMLFLPSSSVSLCVSVIFWSGL